MKVFTEISLKDFDAWSGGKDRLDVLIEQDACDEVERFIDEIFPEGLEETTLNDYLWFDVENDFPQYFNDDEEDEEEEDA